MKRTTSVQSLVAASFLLSGLAMAAVKLDGLKCPISGKAKQAKCPLSGGDLNKETEISIAGAKVQFCCNNCKGKAEKAKGDEQVNLVFGADAWKKGGFKVGK